MNSGDRPKVRLPIDIVVLAEAEIAHGKRGNRLITVKDLAAFGAALGGRIVSSGTGFMLELDAAVLTAALVEAKLTLTDGTGTVVRTETWE